MGFVKFASVSVLAIGLATSAAAQSLNKSLTPANLPPASFTGAQFVDNRGCVFIRAGHSGRVNWIPRVARDRKQICGLKPTFATTRVVKAAPRTAPKAAAPRTTTRVVTAPKTTTRVVRAPQPTTRVVTAPKPTTRVVKTKPKTTTRVVRAPANAKRCQVSSLSAKYMNNSGVRCGSQKANPRSVVGQTSQLVGPKGANRKIREARELRAPAGYASVWDDGRLNPLRGVGTTSGKAKMNLVWSQTVPRYLIDPATGRPATRRQIRLFGG